jgi:hypothetical protein
MHCNSLPAQEVRALLTARKLLQIRNHDVEMSLRGGAARLRAEGGSDDARTFVGRMGEPVTGHSTLSTVAEALPAARNTLFEQCQKLVKRL